MAEVALRLTVTVSRAEEVANGLRAPGEQNEAAIGSWPLFVVSLAAIVAPMLCSWVLAGRRVPGRKSSLVVAGLATVATAAGLAILAPSMVYQFATLPMAVALLWPGRKLPTAPRRTGCASGPGTGDDLQGVPG